MIPYIDRDILRNLLVTLGALLLFLQIGFLVSELLKFARYIFGEGESRLGWVLLYYVFTIPRQIGYTVPVCMAVSVLWVLRQKARQNELLAYLVGGVSPLRIARPLLAAGLVLSVISFIVLDQLATQSDRVAERIRRINIEARSLETLTRETNVFQKGLGNRFYNIQTFDPVMGIMVEPIIIDMRDGWEEVSWSLSAAKAEVKKHDGREQWVFANAVIRRYTPEGSLASYEEHEVLPESSLNPPIEEQLKQLLRQRWRPAQMTTSELAEYMSLFRLQGKPTYELATYLHFNIAIPFGCLVLALLMSGHMLRPSATGIVVGFGGGLVLIGLYYGLLVIMREMSKAGTLDPLFGAHAVNLLFLAIGFWLLNRNRAL